MKKIVTIFLTVFVLIAAIGIFASFALTQNDGWYEIYTAEDLKDFFIDNYQAGTKAKLMNDIDMDGQEWGSTGDVRVDFDGQGYKISNLHKTTDKTGNVGLFVDGLVNSYPTCYTIKNVKFVDCSLTLTSTAGSGANVGIAVGKLDRCAATGITINNCDISMSGSYGEVKCGMVAGSSSWPHSEWDNFNATAVGGVVDNQSSINVAAGTTISTPRFAGIIGACDSSKIYIVDSAFYGTITGASNPVAFIHDSWSGYVLVDCDMVNSTIFATNHKFCYYASSRAASISKADSYLGLAQALNAGYFGDDGNATGNSVGITITADLDFTDKTFVPVTIDYKGTFDGGNKSFSNITYTAEASGKDKEGFQNVGVLFNWLENGAKIRNLTIADSTITFTAPNDAGRTWIGIIAGGSNRALIDNCHLVNTKLTVNGEFGADSYVGGFEGYTMWGNNGRDYVEFTNNTTDENTVIRANGANVTVAGLLGGQTYTWDNPLEMKGCTNNATVISAGNAAGLVGNAPVGNSTITDCANYGAITGVNVNGVVANANGVTLTNVTVGGILTANGGAVNNYGGANVTVGNGCSAPCITNPLSTDNFSIFYQTANATASTVSVRVLVVADLEHLETITANAADVTVKIVFTLNDETTKTFTRSLADFDICKSVTANNDTYVAAEGDCVFGAVVTDVPFADVAKVGVVIETTDLSILDVSADFSK